MSLCTVLCVAVAYDVANVKSLPFLPCVPVAPCGEWLRCPTLLDHLLDMSVVKQACCSRGGRSIGALPLVIDLIMAGSHFPSPFLLRRGLMVPSPTTLVPTQNGPSAAVDLLLAAPVGLVTS